jgi:hypothetical protein
LTPTYDLNAIKKAFNSISKLRMTGTSRKDATNLGFDDQDIINAIQSISENDFYKTMPAKKTEMKHHDVYKFRWLDLYIYLKFQDFNGHLVVSFKLV